MYELDVDFLLVMNKNKMGPHRPYVIGDGKITGKEGNDDKPRLGMGQGGMMRCSNFMVELFKQALSCSNL